MEKIKLISLICILLFCNVFAETPEEKEGVKYGKKLEILMEIALQIEFNFIFQLIIVRHVKY